MNKIVFKLPAGVAMKFSCRNAAHANVWALAAMFGFVFFAPRNTNLGGELGDIFIIFKISPKFHASARLLVKNFTNYGDRWSDVPPGPPADY